MAKGNNKERHSKLVLWNGKRDSKVAFSGNVTIDANWLQDRLDEYFEEGRHQDDYTDDFKLQVYAFESTYDNGPDYFGGVDVPNEE